MTDIRQDANEKPNMYISKYVVIQKSSDCEESSRHKAHTLLSRAYLSFFLLSAKKVSPLFSLKLKGILRIKEMGFPPEAHLKDF